MLDYLQSINAIEPGATVENIVLARCLTTRAFKAIAAKLTDSELVALIRAQREAIARLNISPELLDVKDVWPAHIEAAVGAG
jgi:hypothetical protein